MMEDLTKKQAEFVKEYLETGNGVQSALKVYDTESYKTASNIASENLDKPRIQKYLESIADKAVTRVEQLMEQSENLNVALGASKDILDRAGYKPVDKAEIKQEVTDSSLTSEEKEALKLLIKNERTSLN